MRLIQSVVYLELIHLSSIDPSNPSIVLNSGDIESELPLDSNEVHESRKQEFVSGIQKLQQNLQNFFLSFEISTRETNTTLHEISIYLMNRDLKWLVRNHFFDFIPFYYS